MVPLFGISIYTQVPNYVENINTLQIQNKEIGIMKLSYIGVALMVLFLTACFGDIDMGATGVGEDCEFGLDGNGNCLKEGDDGIPAGH